MEKEQIIKALECCFSNCSCDGCPITDLVDCRRQLERNIFALIKELAEENERLSTALAEYEYKTNIRIAEEYYTAEAYDELREENERLKEKADRHLDNLKAVLEERSENTIVADTVREFAERLKKECLVDSGYEVLQIGTIDRITEEMLKPKECPSCKHFVGCEPSTLGVCDMYEEDEKK